MLNAFRASLPPCVVSSLNTVPSRYADPSNIESINDRGRALWNRIHSPLETKLEHKLGKAHPDLPVIMINNEYGGLFADPERTTGTTIGRIAISLTAIACLRAQRDVDPQLRSHIFGLRKVWEADPEAGPAEAVRWLASDEGCVWVLTKVDELVEALGGVQGNISAPVKAKL
jgi:hypothetical protein